MWALASGCLTWNARVTTNQLCGLGVVTCFLRASASLVSREVTTGVPASQDCKAHGVAQYMLPVLGSHPCGDKKPAGVLIPRMTRILGLAILHTDFGQCRPCQPFNFLTCSKKDWTRPEEGHSHASGARR